MPAGNDKKRILVIEDEPDMVFGLKEAFEFEGFAFASAGKGENGVREFSRLRPDIVIVDLMLPDINGYEVTERIREHDKLVPILILTAKSQESDKIRGFDAGADDYVTKPFSIAELIARVWALFRRTHQTETSDKYIIKVGDTEIDVRKHTLVKNRKKYQLTFYELELLKLLDERRGEVVGRDEILEKIWGIKASPSNRTVDNFIVKLRRRIEDSTDSPQHILTVYGQGYKLV